MKTLKSLKNYCGIDANIEISLFEYGLLCRQYQRSIKKRSIKKNDIHVWYGIQTDTSGNYNLFESAWITEKEINDFLNEDWFDKKAFLSYVGMNEKIWKACYYPTKIHDLLQYYGFENIFGSCYYPIEIK